MLGVKLKGLNGIPCHSFEGKDTITIGRNPMATVVLTKAFISRNHCDITLKDGKWHLHDHSSAGSHINGLLVGKGKEKEVKDADKITLGVLGTETVEWIFHSTSTDESQSELEMQSQMIMDLTRETQDLEGRISCSKSSKMLKERRLLESEAKYRTKLKDLASRQQDSNSAIDDAEKNRIEQEWKEEKEKLVAEIATHCETEVRLREEIEKFKSSLENEKREMEIRLSEMKENLQTIVRNNEKDVKATRDEMSAASELKQKELADLLAKEEKEKKEMAAQLEAMQQDKVRFECDYQAVLEQKKQLEEAKQVEEPKTSSTSDFENLFEADLQCSICNEPFITATTLNCSHTFCAFCLQRWKLNQRTCPVCRAPITAETRSLALDNFISNMTERLGEDYKKRRAEVLAERKRDEAPPAPAPRGRGGRGRGRGGRAGRGAARAAANTNTAYNTTRRRRRRDETVMISSDDDVSAGNFGLVVGEVVEISNDSWDEPDSNESSESTGFTNYISDEGITDSDSMDDVNPPPYGYCYVCGDPGHWSPQCPNRRR